MGAHHVVVLRVEGKSRVDTQRGRHSISDFSTAELEMEQTRINFKLVKSLSLIRQSYSFKLMFNNFIMVVVLIIFNKN